MNCQEIQTQYEILTNNIPLFRQAQRIGFKKEKPTALACKKKIEDALKVLNELFSAKITVENAENPFAEVYEQNGMPRPGKEKKEIDLEAQMNEDLKSYRGCKLDRWAEDIEKARGRLKHLSREKKKQIAQELQEGAVAIFMPGREVQFSLTVEELTRKLKPFWKKAGKEENVADSYLDWDHFKKLIINKAKELVADVPEKPYILLTKPTQSPEERTKNKIVDDQKKELVKINKERRKAGKAAQYDMKPHEYASLQKFFTERAEKSGVDFEEITPLDDKTFTRFISLPLEITSSFPGGLVPCAFWAQDYRQLYFNRGDAECAYPYGGVRLSVRILI